MYINMDVTSIALQQHTAFQIVSIGTRKCPCSQRLDEPTTQTESALLTLAAVSGRMGGG
jgi:hypothetical protein